MASFHVILRRLLIDNVFTPMHAPALRERATVVRSGDDDDDERLLSLTALYSLLTFTNSLSDSVLLEQVQSMLCSSE